MILSILLFYLGVAGHEYIHILQLKKAGYNDYEVVWLFVFPIAVRFRYYFLKPTNLLTWEIIPSVFTIFCWYLAYILW